MKGWWQSPKNPQEKFIRRHWLAPTKELAHSVGSPTSEGSVQQLAARLPPTFSTIAHGLYRPALGLAEAQSLTCIFLPEVNVNLRDENLPESQESFILPSSLSANFYSPVCSALPPHLPDKILALQDAFLQEFSLASALQPPQRGSLHELSKRLISLGLTWTLDSPCSVFWVVFPCLLNCSEGYQLSLRS